MTPEEKLDEKIRIDFISSDQIRSLSSSSATPRNTQRHRCQNDNAMDLDSPPPPSSKGKASATRPAPYRNYKTGPVYRLTKSLLQTYVHINDVYYEAANRRKRQIPPPVPVDPLRHPESPKKNKSSHSQPQLQRPPNEPATHNHGYDDENDDYIIHENETWNNRFKIIRLLGRGSFGQVVEAHDLHQGGNDNRVAIKIIKNRRSFKAQALIEVRILEYLNAADPDDSKNIVRMNESFMHRGHLCLVYEMLSLNLYELLKSEGLRGLSLGLVRRFAAQILLALSFLSRPNVQVVHCDMKPENILLRDHQNKGSALKVIDFGSSCFINERAYSYIQSRFYRSPEVILGAPYGCPIDVWSLGCILMELLTGTPIFPGTSEHDQLLLISRLLGPLPSSLVSSGQREKVAKLVTRNPDGTYSVVPLRNSNSTGGSATRAATGGLVGGRPGQEQPTKTLWDVVKERVYDDAYRMADPEAPSVKTSSSQPTASIQDYAKFTDLLARMLEYDSSLRIRPDEALQHAFFKPCFDQAVNTNWTHHPSLGQPLHPTYAVAAEPNDVGCIRASSMTTATTPPPAGSGIPVAVTNSNNSNHSSQTKPTISLPSQQSHAPPVSSIVTALPIKGGTVAASQQEVPKSETKRQRNSNARTNNTRTYNTRSHSDPPVALVETRTSSSSTTVTSTRSRTRRAGLGGLAGSRD
ncbi:hypothetical protein SmJEL517_g04486 [Synchytrium microbalum]|uniref:Protein kinase domain-containing protein n=1 Tax=Synchytrium microbalum TaxID=1806994 RepID=A0A507BZD6_9FUNG|nr:uncharacterized protein SmJEL517_g04486 [Synchytrium microbalum]TPX32468.1 hypothetical protein SmJEL517_g04486 [Synchytrium microbalum]